VIEERWSHVQVNAIIIDEKGVYFYVNCLKCKISCEGQQCINFSSEIRENWNNFWTWFELWVFHVSEKIENDFFKQRLNSNMGMWEKHLI
jgi:hypothetical protein